MTVAPSTSGNESAFFGSLSLEPRFNITGRSWGSESSSGCGCGGAAKVLRVPLEEAPADGRVAARRWDLPRPILPDDCSARTDLRHLGRPGSPTPPPGRGGRR